MSESDTSETNKTAQPKEGLTFVLSQERLVEYIMQRVAGQVDTNVKEREERRNKFVGLILSAVGLMVALLGAVGIWSLIDYKVAKNVDDQIRERIANVNAEIEKSRSELEKKIDNVKAEVTASRSEIAGSVEQKYRERKDHLQQLTNQMKVDLEKDAAHWKGDIARDVEILADKIKREATRDAEATFTGKIAEVNAKFETVNSRFEVDVNYDEFRSLVLSLSDEKPEPKDLNRILTYLRNNEKNQVVLSKRDFPNLLEKILDALTGDVENDHSAVVDELEVKFGEIAASTRGIVTTLILEYGRRFLSARDADSVNAIQPRFRKYSNLSRRHGNPEMALFYELLAALKNSNNAVTSASDQLAAEVSRLGEADKVVFDILVNDCVTADGYSSQMKSACQALVAHYPNLRGKGRGRAVGE